MINKLYFPLSKITGQEKAKLALKLALVNDKVGGVILFGSKGSGKSTLLRSLQDISSRKLINVPLNITDDMLLGSIDIEKAIKEGRKVLTNSVLNRAENNILYVDDINLLRVDLIKILQENSSKYTLLAGANVEESELSLTILDKFGLSVTLEEVKNPKDRCEIIINNLCFEKNSFNFRNSSKNELEKIKQDIEVAKAILNKVEISQQILELIAVYCNKANCCGHRGELFMVEAAKALAALENRSYVLPGDIDIVAEFVLAHRLRKEEKAEENINNSEDSDQEQSENNENNQEDEEPTEELNREEKNESFEGEDEKNDSNEDEDNEEPQNEENKKDGLGSENTDDIDKSFANLSIKISDIMKNKNNKNGQGKRSFTKTSLKQGRYVRAFCKQNVSDLAFDATLRAAAPYQKLRYSPNTFFVIEKSDLRQKIREKRVGNTFIFVVDASGSMGVRMRMKAVKGAIFSLLNDAYQKRDQVGMIAFRRENAEIILPVTRSVDLAQKALQNLPTGGKTPLVEGITKTYELVKKLQSNGNGMEPIVILITDGRADNIKKGCNLDDILNGAEKLGEMKVKSVVIDTENDFIKFGFAKKIANAMSANYYHLEQLSQQHIINIVKNYA